MANPIFDGQISPEDAQKYRQVIDALDRRDTYTAESILQELRAKDPNMIGLHMLWALLYGTRGEDERAVEQLQREEEVHPELVIIYQSSADYFLEKKKYDKAADEYRKWLKVDPKNYEAMLGLSQILSYDNKTGEAVVVLEKAQALMPDRPDIRQQLTVAYIRAQQFDKGMQAADKELGAAAKPTPEVLNMVAYTLAEANVHLDRAQEWGERALQGLEKQSLKADTEGDALSTTRDIAAVWDTLGWVYFRRGEFDKAERYLRASFTLSQDSEVGDHLAQVYEQQGKKQQAAHTYLLSLAAADGKDKSAIRKHYVKLTGKQPGDPAHPPASARSSAADKSYSPGEELSRARSYKVSAPSHAIGSATFSMVFAPGSIEGARFVSGESKLKALDGAIKSSSVRTEFPNEDNVHITRRGILVCTSLGCDITLLLPEDVYNVE
jgi:tetratricopeptide (TPR) repeat protein